MATVESIQINSLEELESFGKQLSQHLIAGTIVLLYGNLGSGKTTLSRAICVALGVSPEQVTSPTYTIANVYEATQTIHHVDLYRLSAPEDLDAFDEEDLFCQNGLTLIEWPQYAEELLPIGEPLLKIEFTVVDQNKRHLLCSYEHLELPKTLFTTC